MADDPRPPVAIRITRPYTTEDEFLEQELDTLNRTSVTLLGAQPRPQGVVLRFELVLSSGHVLMRGEGRVVGFRPNAHQGLGGLTLRFTRLDSRSKALVDKAAGLRERRRPSAAPGGASAPAAAPAPAAVPPEPRPPFRSDPEPEPEPGPPFRSDPESEARPPFRSDPEPEARPPFRSDPGLDPQPPFRSEPDAGAAAGTKPLDLEATHAEAPVSKRAEQPAGRDALLDRLRARAKTLDGAAVQRILEQRRRRAT